jgi:hypothetical protein
MIIIIVLTCRLNSTSVYYKASTTQIKHNTGTITNTQKQNTKKPKRSNEKNQYKKAMGQRP